MEEVAAGSGTNHKIIFTAMVSALCYYNQRKREFSFQQPIFYLKFRWVNVYYMHGRFNKKIGLRIQNTLQQSEGSATALLGVQDLKSMHWISRGFRISDWISDVFHVDFYIIFIVDLDFWAGPGAKATCIWCINICINKYACMTYCTRHLGKRPCTRLKIGRVQRSLLCTDVKCYYVIQNLCTPV